MGSYEPEFQASLLALCEITKDRLIFFDVGAHIGLYSAIVCAIFNDSNPYIVAFEPTPETAKDAHVLRDSNNLLYTILKKAVSDTYGFVDLHISDKAETSNSLNPDFRDGDTLVSVPLTTIDRAMEDGLMAPTVMKIDVETFEAEVLQGSLKTIRTYQPFITLELLNGIDKTAIHSMLRAIECFGYKFYRVENERASWQANTADQAVERISSKYRDWICVAGELGDDFYDAADRWRAALIKCDKTTNVMVEAGTPIPDELLGYY